MGLEEVLEDREVGFEVDLEDLVVGLEHNLVGLAAAGGSEGAEEGVVLEEEGVQGASVLVMGFVWGEPSSFTLLAFLCSSQNTGT